jgi:mono/diheme cytochrome c family protein
VLPIVAAALTLGTVLALAQERKSVWDGVYTAEQAAKGKAAYDVSCVGCHGADLAGLSGPELAGNRFRTKWDFQTLNQLYSEMKTRMPRNNPSTLSDETYLDLVTYLLQANAFPAGSAALAPDSALMTGILIQKTKGGAPAELPTGTLVQVLGCLAPTADSGWMLTSATAPARTESPDASKEDQRTALQSVPAGTRSIQLMGVYGSMDEHKGHRMEAKGFLIRDPAGDRLNVASIEMVGPTCGS